MDAYRTPSPPLSSKTYLNMIKTAKSDIIGPTITADDPLRQLGEHVSLGPDLVEQRGGQTGLAYFRDKL